MYRNIWPKDIPIKEIARVSGLSLVEPEYITTPNSGQVIKLKVRSINSNYFLKLGFLDGWHGYIIAKIYAKYTFWKYSK